MSMPSRMQHQTPQFSWMHGTANKLTMARMFMIPVVLAMMWFIDGLHEPMSPLYVSLSFGAAILFVIAGITDIIDGRLARQRGEITVFGQLMDPMADKMMHLAVMVVLVEMGRLSSGWVLVLMLREFWISGLRSLAAHRGLVMQAEQGGKYKTAWLNCALTPLIVFHSYADLSFYSVGMICLAIATFFSLHSGIRYTQAFFKELR